MILPAKIEKNNTYILKLGVMKSANSALAHFLSMAY
jgi:hypothetical protein